MFLGIMPARYLFIIVSTISGRTNDRWESVLVFEAEGVSQG